MTIITSRMLVGILTFTIGVGINSFVNRSSAVEKTLTYAMKAAESLLGNNTEAKWRTGGAFNPFLPTEITLERIYDGCEDCPDRKLILYSQGTGKFEVAAVTEVDLHTGKVRRGKLDSYYYGNLMRFINSQGYFTMDNAYAMQWVDSLVVTMTVAVDGRHKRIITTSEGEVPVQLWGIYRAIDGVREHVKWEADFE